MIRHDYMGGCGDSNNDDFRLTEGERQTLGSNSRYVSQFANKVRQDADQRKKACWSSMGIPTTELDPPSSYLRKFSRQLPSHVSVSDFERENSSSRDLTRTFGTDSKLSLHSNYYSAHQNVPLRMGKTLPNIASNRSRTQKTPILVRNRRIANFRDSDFALPLINGVRSSNSNNDKFRQLDTDNDKNDKDKLAVKDECEDDLSLLTCLSSADKNKNDESVNLNELYGANDNIDKRNMRSSIPNLLNPSHLVTSSPVNNIKSLSHQEQQELINRFKAKIKLESKEQQTRDLCDAFILQRILELRGNPNCPNNADLLERGDTEEVTSSSDRPTNQETTTECQSNCYNGKVAYIERGEKDFILENAIKCSQMPAKIPPRKIVDDCYGNGQNVGLRRMVFKQDYGQVPDYIIKRWSELEDEKEVLNQVMESNKQCRQLTDDEREAIINGLNGNWEELFVEFQKLPLFSSSPRVIKRKAEIETKLRDLESDLRLISRHGRLFVSARATESQFLWQ